MSSTFESVGLALEVMRYPFNAAMDALTPTQQQKIADGLAAIDLSVVAHPELREAVKAVINLNNLRRDVKQNAALYVAQADAGYPVDAIAKIAVEDAKEYVRRLGPAFLADDPTARHAGYAALNLDAAEELAIIAEIQPVALAQRDVPLVSKSDLSILKAATDDVTPYEAITLVPTKT